MFRRLIIPFLASLILLGCSRESNSDGSTENKAQAKSAFPVTFDGPRLTKVGADACVECHLYIVEEWKSSHHAHANRPIKAALDQPAFDPAQKVETDGFVYKMFQQGNDFAMSVTTPEGETEHYSLVGVLGYTPLRQYLAKFPGGRLQVTTTAYDSQDKHWFNVYDDGRLPGEWGHWTGQGMNWNANCAYCHMTEYHKGFDIETLSYNSHWLTQGISCVQCHNDMEAHVANARSGGEYIAPEGLSGTQIIESCASCHSRREELTPEIFRPGDAYDDHYSLVLPTVPGLYYPDGQIRDEVFVYGSFMMSRMGHAGVSCLDCHNAHSGATHVPPTNNALCMRCHDTGQMNAPIIQPTLHSRHAEGSTGNQCVSCHMPTTTYMQNDPRRDHGFLHPDPLMTRELGIPNACSTCHTDESLDWAIEHAEAWYGKVLADTPQRKRAHALNDAYEGNPDAGTALLALAEDEPIDAWRATYTGLLGSYAYDSRVLQYLKGRLSDGSAMVRSRAVSSLGWTELGEFAIQQGLGDPVREVRITASREAMNRGMPLPSGKVSEEWQTFLEFHADRPQEAMILAQQAMQNGNPQEATRLLEFAVSLDRANPELLRRAAVFSSLSGDNQSAEAYLHEALNRDPKNPQVLYSLALLSAESGNIEDAALLLRETVQQDPTFYRAWYNLSLCYTKLGDWQAAREAIIQAAPGMANDPNWQTTRSIIDQQLQIQQVIGQ